MISGESPEKKEPAKDSYYEKRNEARFFLSVSVDSVAITSLGIETENVSILLFNVYV